MHSNIVHSNYDDFRFQSFQRNGFLITIEGSDSGKIKLETLTNYIVPLPSQVTVSNDKTQQEMPNPAEPDTNIQPESDVETEIESNSGFW